MFADITFLPDGDKETALIGSGYAGAGFGAYMPPTKGDVVLVAVPMGDPGYGPIIVARIWDQVNHPAPEFGDTSTPEDTDATPDPTIRVKDGSTYRFVMKNGANLNLSVEGAGTVTIEAKGNAQVVIQGEAQVIVNSPDVRLGAAPGQRVARIGDLVAVSIPPMVVVGFGPVVPLTGIPTPSGGVSGSGQIISGASSVKA